MPDCESCDDLREEGNQAPLRHMDPSQRECRVCPLFVRSKEDPVPEDCQYAWTVAQFLSGPGIERFHLHDHALKLLDLDQLDETDALELIEGLNGIADGEHKAREFLQKEANAKKDKK